ncbi:MAG: hypothetical protein ACK46X_02645 [Candidatus Sericytochromatia bacterium]
MRARRWLGWGLTIGLWGGCLAGPPDRGSGGGGGSAPRVTQDAVLTRDYVGNAYLAAARAHRAIAMGNYRAGRSDLFDVRRALRFAAQSADADQQAEIARMIEELDRLEAAVTRGDPRAVTGTRRMLDALVSLFDTYAGVGAGGGAGAVP